VQISNVQSNLDPFLLIRSAVYLFISEVVAVPMISSVPIVSVIMWYILDLAGNL